MKSQTLTNDLRSRIADKIVREKFTIKKQELEKEILEFNHLIIQDLLPEEFKKEFKKELHFVLNNPGWFPKEREFKVKFGPTIAYINLDKSVLVPYYLFQGNVLKIYEAGSPFETLYNSLENRVSHLENERRELRTKINAILNSVNTTKQLLSVWPEVEPYIPDYCKNVPNLPSVLISEVNQLIKGEK